MLGRPYLTHQSCPPLLEHELWESLKGVSQDSTKNMKILARSRPGQLLGLPLGCCQGR